MSAPGFFITGTDTEVGKTWVGSTLVATLYQRGVPVSPRKPIESGCASHEGTLIPADGSKYYEAIDHSMSLDIICPLRLKTAISPARAAVLENKPISLNDAVEACATSPNTIPIVEGAGGFYSPITTDGSNADLAKALGYPVIIVARDKLGCLNHIQLTAHAIEHQGLSVAAVVLNPFGNNEIDGMDNEAELKTLASFPVISTADEQWAHRLAAALGVV
jgi:dethiobiotin synthetase